MIGSLGAFWTCLSIVSLLTMVPFMCTVEWQRRNYKNDRSIFADWVLCFYLTNAVLWLIVVNVVHKVLMWELMLAFSGVILVIYLVFNIHTSRMTVDTTKDRNAKSMVKCTLCLVETSISRQHYHNSWLNLCITNCNRAALVRLLAVTLATGVYQTHLSMTSVCTPSMVLRWFLVANDCRYVYSDILYSWLFSISCFNILFTSFIGLLLLMEISRLVM